MSTTPAIPLQAVRDALMFAVIRKKAMTEKIARFAAYTDIQLLTGVTCSSPAHRRASPQRCLGRVHLSGLSRGDLGALVERQKLEHGLAEVRRTWGTGLRALQAECKGYSLP
ncbi:hypothetical protein [Variovorax sp.]|uniref:hypothetical protein n=1 Tax=Variovorax sp. TaxID=1871043 RepID=UPI003BAAD6C0